MAARAIPVALLLLLPGCLLPASGNGAPGVWAGHGVSIHWPPPIDSCTRDHGREWLSGMGPLAERLDEAGARNGVWSRGDLLSAIDGTWVQVMPEPLYLRGVGEVAGYAVPGGVVVACRPTPEASALAHEWAHIYGFAFRSNPDHNHSGGGGWWGGRVEAAIREANSGR